VSLSWTATPTTWATGHVVQRGLAGVFSDVTTVTPRTTVTYVNTGLAITTTYQFRVRAKYLNWTSAASNTITVTTPTLCL
jgi:hypothetical protein